MEYLDLVLETIKKPETLIALSVGFGLGKLKPSKLGGALVAVIKKVTPKPIRNVVLSFLNRFAKGIDRAIDDKSVK